MKWLASARLACLGMFLLSAVLPMAAIAEVARLPNEITLYAGETVVHRVDGPLKRVAVGNGDIVQVESIGGNELVIIGSKPGDTSLHLWLKDGRQRSVTIRIVYNNAAQLADVVRQLLSGVERAKVLVVGGNVVVTGSDLSPHAAAKVAAVQKIYPRVVNFSTVDPVAMRPMVLMDVQVMEFDRNALEELGIRWDTSISGPTGGLVKDFTTNDYYRVVPDQESQFDDLPLDLPGTQAFMGIATTIASRINLLVNKGKAYALASPQLSARSGGSAEFLAGGEVPIPLASAFGQTDVTFKEYGIRLHIEPVVNENNEILASMMTEVSRIDPSVSVAGIPGFITRRAKTEVNVRSGETIVISGLTDLNAAKSVDKFPFLGDIPILGRLFRSDNFRANRTELVIFITPRIVDAQSSENREVIDAGKAIRRDFEQTIGQDIVE